MLQLLFEVSTVCVLDSSMEKLDGKLYSKAKYNVILNMSWWGGNYKNKSQPFFSFHLHISTIYYNLIPCNTSYL